MVRNVSKCRGGFAEFLDLRRLGERVGGGRIVYRLKGGKIVGEFEVVLDGRSIRWMIWGCSLSEEVAGRSSD